MDTSVSRRDFLRNTLTCGFVAAGAAVAMHSMLPAEAMSAPSKMQPWPWPYSPLDPEAGRKLGHDSYYSGKGCCYGSFHAIMELLRQTVGDPYTLIPSEIMVYGHGGAVGWGTLCGALNGAAAAISLATDKKASDILVSELLGWYSQAHLPSDCSNHYAMQKSYMVNKCEKKLQQSKSDSPLCHISVSKWCGVTGFKINDAERKDRCARLVGDCVAYAVNILNDNYNGVFKPVYAEPETVTNCSSCHGETQDVADVLSKMNCQQCHGDPHIKGVQSHK